MRDIHSLKTTILLVVSDPVVRWVLEETLEVGGYMVVAAGNLGDAVERLRDIKPQLLIVRGHIDNLPGHDAAIYLQKKYPPMRVLILGGLLDDDRLQNREFLCGFEVFPKPYTSVELLQKVKDVLEAAADRGIGISPEGRG